MSEILYDFLSMVELLQPCSQRTMEFRGHGKYKACIPLAFKLKLIENSTYTNSIEEKLITITPLGKRVLKKEISIADLLKGSKEK